MKIQAGETILVHYQKVAVGKVHTRTSVDGFYALVTTKEAGRVQTVGVVPAR